MILSGRRLLLGLSLLFVACAALAWLQPEGWKWLSLLVGLVGVGLIVAISVVRRPMALGAPEPDDIDELPPARRAELVRGTSKFLAEMRYRYSVRIDPSGVTGRRCFTAEVNTVRLGFVPAVVTDNTTDRQGYGYVAFVYDQRRWRGPGLPCPDGQSEAVKHAARCVSPLSKDEETKW